VSFVAELRRRNVIRMAGLYLVGAWLLTQVASTVLPAFEVPGWALRALILVLAIGFVPALIFAWVFELTPQGIKRDVDVKPEESIAPQTARRMDRTIIVVLAVALGYFAFDKFVLAPRHEAARIAAASGGHEGAAKRETAGAQAIPTDSSIAVLPFVNMSSDKEQEYFSDGLSEELLNQLAQIPQLRVIARTSSFSFKGKEADVATIAKALNVANVLEGSVRKSANTLRITAQLIRASDSSHLWSQTYDRDLTDVFKVQDEISKEVVSALKVRLLPDQVVGSGHRSGNIEAYNQFLLANDYFKRSTQDGFERAIVAYRKAIALDPGYAAAYAALAKTELFLFDRLGDAPGLDQAVADAEKAVALGPDQSEGYVTRGMCRLSIQHDWAGARTDLEKALALSPGDANVQLGYGRMLIALGRVPEALAAARRATELDPLFAGSWHLFGRMLNASGRYPEAREALERSLAINPESDPSRFHRGMSSLLAGDAQGSLAYFRPAGSAYGLAGVAMAEHSLGHARESQAALDDAIAKYAKGGAYQIAEVYAWRGEKDKAFEWLERALAQRDGGVAFMQTDPLVASLKGDARYQAFLEKMGLPQ
jgi:TolB-like protein/Flp pilus assembly protein TadD